MESVYLSGTVFLGAPAIYYSAGPPAMVAGMRAMLVSAGVDEDDIRTEDFAGY